MINIKNMNNIRNIYNMRNLKNLKKSMKGCIKIWRLTKFKESQKKNHLTQAMKKFKMWN